MAEKKVRYFNIDADKSSFVTRFINPKKEQDLSDVKILRSLLSNQKSRILYTIKKDNPKSIYELSKILKRDFKSVQSEVKMLEKFGFIDLVLEKKGKRKCLRPVISASQIQIIVNI